MCGGPNQQKSTATESNTDQMNNPTVESIDSFSSLLELAANNDIEGFKQAIDRGASSINEVGFWYGRKKGSKQMVLEHRTPLMVAATYGSVDVLKLILDQSEADVNLSCGPDNTTALHCASSSGSIDSVEVVKLLLVAGADPNCVDGNGDRPVDVITVPPKLPNMKVSLETLLSTSDDSSNGSILEEKNLRIVNESSGPNSPVNGSSPSSPLDSVSSPMAHAVLSEKKEYPIDPSLPDIKNSIYSTDEFRMFSFKVKPCSRAYSHDWTECPFVHPGENARRRDPRKYHYSCVPCPDFRKGACRRGDMCEYAHGVFECWLHPAQYRTRLCKDGVSCARRVCFFAHLPEELRPLYVSTGSAIPSPRSSNSPANAMDMAAAMSLLSGSPVSGMSNSPFSQSLSPSASMAWPQPNVPTLHLPGSNFQSSRLRSSLNARDILSEDYNLLSDRDHQHLLNEFACYSQQQPSHSSPVSLSRPGRSNANTLLTPSNLEELFATEVFSPSHKSALLNQFQQQQSSMLSPINTRAFSPKNVDHPLFQASYGVPSPGRMSPRSVDPISPMGSRLSGFGQQHQQLRSLSSRDLGSNINTNSPIVGSPINSWSKWGSPGGKADWSVNGDELGRMQRPFSSSEVGNNNGEEPDLSWVQSLVKESPPEMKEKAAVSGSDQATSSAGENFSRSNSQIESVDQSVIGAWLEQMQLDQLVA